ncbi:unnamed protein product [Prunus brigantina]
MLGEYFPKVFFVRGQMEKVHMTTCYQVDDEDALEGKSETHEEQKVSVQIEDSLSHFNIEEAMQLPEAIRVALVKALMDLNFHPNKIRRTERLEHVSQDHAICCVTCVSITFTDEDILLGSKPHNRPLFVAMDMIKIELVIGDLKSNTLFHVIDAKTSYKLLLGRPWVHENGIVPSTLHQCFKFYRGKVKKILGDSKPFTEVESYFANAKFYMDEDMVSQVIPVEVHSTGKAIPRRDEHSKCLPTEVKGDKQSKSISSGQMGS